MKATFFSRLGAYLVDTIIISFILILITNFIPVKNTDASDKLVKAEEQVTAGEITYDEYLEIYMDSDLQVDYQKENLVPNLIFTGITIAYFVVFQYMNKGQTIGKKAFHIQVVDQETEKPTTIMKGLLRSIFIVSIASNVLNFIYLLTLSSSLYLKFYIVTVGAESLFILVSAIFILYRKDGLGLHDMMANTKVIKERG